MTNTNDFRQYSYQTDTARLISSFNYTRGSHAPKVRPEYGEEPARKLRATDAKGIKSEAQLRHETRVSRNKAIRVIAVAVLFLAMLGVVLNSFVIKNQLTREISKQETAIANAQSEYISLQSQLNIMYSVSMVDKYAVNKLKMSKVRQGQIQYMDVDSFKANQLKKKKTADTKKKLTPAQAAVAAAKKTKKSDKKTSEKKPENTDDADFSDDAGADGEVINE